MSLVDDTHDASLVSWLESANDPSTDFPIQNLPFGRFRVTEREPWRVGVAIGDHVLDLQKLGLAQGGMESVLGLSSAGRRLLRKRLSEGLRPDGTERAQFADAMVRRSEVELGLPCDIRNYTDFYIGIHHATSVGKLFRPDSPLLPNYKWVPIGYHGRASTLTPSGVAFARPVSQARGPDDLQPSLRPTQRLDYELELGAVVAAGNSQGTRITIDEAEERIFGLTLLNDWSARDVQAWEYQPLGPFLSKNFASTLSPWMVTMEALAPFRKQWVRDAGDPQPLPYLDSTANRKNGAVDIELQVWLSTSRIREEGAPSHLLSRSNFADAAYWSLAQLVAHHTVNGCALQSGDLLGTGTLSGPLPEQAGSLLELTEGGSKPLVLSNGEQRRFLEDGDCVTFRAYCVRDGFRRIGFGECRAEVLPAR